MRSGSLEHRLELYRPEERAGRFSDYGGTDWVLDSTVRSERVKQSAKMQEQAGAEFFGRSCSYYVHYGARVAEGWRARESGGPMMRVTGVESLRQKGIKKIDCEKINE